MARHILWLIEPNSEFGHLRVIVGVCEQTMSSKRRRRPGTSSWQKERETGGGGRGPDEKWILNPSIPTLYGGILLPPCGCFRPVCWNFLLGTCLPNFHASSPMMGWPCSFNLRDSSVSEHEKLTMKQHTIQRTVYFISSGGSESDRYEVKQLRAHADDTVFGVVRERTGHNRQICSTCCGSSVLSVMALSII